MRILFLQDNGINESLALTELSAYLKSAGHTTELFLEREEKISLAKLLISTRIYLFSHVLSWRTSGCFAQQRS